MKSHHQRQASGRLLVSIQALIALILLISPAMAQEPQPDIRDLTLDQPITRKVAGTEIHVYGVEVKQGQVLRVRLQERGADVAMVVIQAATQQKASAASNFGSGFMQESLTLTPSQEGIYALVVRAQQVADGESAYELSASLGQATQQDVQRAQAEKLLEEGAQSIASSDQKSLLNAIRSFGESLRIWQTIQDPYWEGMTKTALGAAYLKSENVPQAERNLSEALRIFEARRDEPEIAAVCLNIGTLYITTKNEGKAQPYLSRAVEISRRLGDKRAESLLGLVAIAPLGTEDSERNKSDYRQDLSAARAKNDKAAEAAIWASAVLHYAADEESMSTPDAKVLLERAEREALPLVRALKDSNLELTIVVGLGIGFYNFTLDGNSDEAADSAYKEKSMRYVREGLVFARIRNNPIMQALAYNQLNLYYDGDNDGLAIFYAKQVVNAFQGIRQDLRVVDKEIQQDAARKLEEVYDELAGDLIYEDRLSEAHQIVNFGRDQEFFDLKLIQSLKPERTAFNRRESEADGALESVLQRMVSKYGGQLSPDYQSGGRELSATFANLENIFRGSRSAKEKAPGVSDTVDMQSTLRELNAKTGQKYAAIYVVGDVGDNGVLLITPESIMAFTGGALNENVGATSGDAEEDVTEFLKVLNSPTLDPRPLGARLYYRIFKTKVGTNTLEAELTRTAPDVLLWSLGGRLRYVPVSALYDPEQKKYLAEKYQNAVFTRAQKQRFLAEPRTWTEGVGFGTSIAYEGLPALPGVSEELLTIFGDSATEKKGLISGKVFLNRSFTRQALNSVSTTKPALVHIASHFKFAAGDSRNSFLLLGDGNRLSLFDMQQTFNLFAGVDLLTLSACETAAQQAGAAGVEVDGFAELAQRLGANSVIATLWKISDNGTSKLMTEFYKLHQENPAKSKGALLRESQLNLLNGRAGPASLTRQRVVRGTFDTADVNSRARIPFKPRPEAPFAHPYYWAPFVLYGNPR